MKVLVYIFNAVKRHSAVCQKRTYVIKCTFAGNETPEVFVWC